MTYLAVFLYFSLISIIVFKDSWKKTTTSSDYATGNRNINFYVTAISAHASDMSSWLFMAFPMMLYTTGITGLWVGIGLIGGMTLNWLLIARFLRQKTQELECSSLSLLLQKCYNDKSNVLKFATSLTCLFFLLAYLSSGIMGSGYLLESLFHLPYEWGCILSTFIILLYTLVGGYTSIAYTDFFQGMFLLLALILVAAVSVFQLSPADNIILLMKEKNLSLTLLDFSSSEKTTNSLQAMFAGLAWGVGYLGQPHILNRFIGIDDEKNLKKAAFVGLAWEILAFAGAGVVGICAISYFQGRVVENNELLFITMVQEMFTPFISSFILCSILSASISTMDSQLLVLSTSMMEDFYLPYKKSINEKEKITFLRVSSLLLAIIPLFIALFKVGSISSVVQYAWSGLGGTFGPLLLAILIFKKLPSKAGILILFSGAFICLFYPCWESLIPQLSYIPSILLSLFVGLLIAFFLKDSYKK